MRLAGLLGLVFMAGCVPEATPDTVVYVTKKGAKYHRRECRLKSGSHAIKLGDLSGKYEPCSVCDPPVLKRR